MKCLHCQGTMRRASAPFHIDRNGYHVSLDAIPAWVCAQCGEPFLDEREVTAIQSLLAQMDEQMARMASAA
jgi:YgiT-type zinc finger domain-containing protein